MLWCMADTTSTPKAQQLGAALRKARTEQALSVRGLAGELGIDHGLLSRIETGKTIPKDRLVSRILGHLNVNGERYEEIMQMLQGVDAPQWLAVTLPEQRQHQNARIDFENNADTIWEVGPLLIPGLIQDSAYARAMMKADSSIPPDELASRVAVRLGRRDIITRRDPVKLVALIGESALRFIIGSRDVMLGQLEYLCTTADLPNVDLRVVPFAAGWNPLLEGPFALIDPREAEGAMSIVALGGRRSGLILHSPEDVAAYRQAVDAVLRAAMSPAETRRLIADVIEEMRTG